MTDDVRAAVASLLGLFELRPDGDDRWSGSNPEYWPGGRLFGGLVASQALRAAQLSVDVDHAVHSIHGHFLRPGRNGIDVGYAVERLRDGRSFTTRRVTAVQRGEAIFALTASFHAGGEDSPLDYQLPRAADAPLPDDVADRTGGFPVQAPFSLPFDMRDVGPTEPAGDGTYRSTRRVWIRAAATLPDDPALHACVLAFVSDMAVIVAARPPDPDVPIWERFSGASLDHAVWFHRPFRADEWMLTDLQTVSNADARGLVRGSYHSVDGRLVASIAQECLTRPTGERPPPVP